MAYFREIKFRAAWWQQLKRLGYDVIPLYAKDAPCKGWPTMSNDEAAIADWSGAGAGGPDAGLGAAGDRSGRPRGRGARSDDGLDGRAPSGIHGEMSAPAFGGDLDRLDRPHGDGEGHAEDRALRRRGDRSEGRFRRDLHRQLARSMSA